MAFICKLTDGVEEVDLYYSAAAGISLLDEGIRPGVPEQLSLYGGIDGAQLIRHYDGRRRVPLELYVEGSDDDDLINRITALQRLVNKARDPHLLDFGGEVWLEFKLKDASYTSRFQVLTGEANLDRIMSMFCKEIPVVDTLPLVLTCKPYWEGTATYRLKNYCGNPHFIRDTDGLANQWVEIGTPTTTIDPTYYLAGGQSQKVVTDTAGDDGIYFQQVYSGATELCGYAWVVVDSPGDEVVVELYDASTSTVKDTALFSTAGWRTKIGKGGKTWKRLEVSSSSITGANNNQLRILRRSGDASQATTFYVDMCYLEWNTTDIPTLGWISQSTLVDHWDDDNGHINILDWGDIPGDAPALVSLSLENRSMSNLKRVWMASRTHNIADAPWFHDLQGTSDESRVGDEYQEITPTSTSWEPFASWYVGDKLAGFHGSLRLLACIYDAGATAADWRVRAYLGQECSLYRYSREVQRNHDDGWHIIDLGTIDIPDGEFAAGPINWDFGLVLQVRRTSGTEAAKADFLMALPTHDISAAISIHPLWDYATTNILEIDHLREPSPRVYLRTSSRISSLTNKYSITDVYLTPPEGRLYFMFVGGGTASDPGWYHYCDADLRVTLEFRPRGIHMMAVE